LSSSTSPAGTGTTAGPPYLGAGGAGAYLGGGAGAA